MMPDKEFFLLPLIAVFAITGLVLMLTSAPTGMNTVSKRLFYSYKTYDDTRAMDVNMRFSKGGNTGGVEIQSFDRAGHLACTGYHPCAYPFKLTPWEQIRDIEACEEVKEECKERYPPQLYMCCPLLSV